MDMMEDSTNHQNHLPLASSQNDAINSSPSSSSTMSCQVEGSQKLSLDFINSEEFFSSLVQKLKDLLESGAGETLYQVGCYGEDGSNSSVVNSLNEDEFKALVTVLSKAANTLDADHVLLRSKKTADRGLSAEYLIRKRADTNDFQEVRVAVVGNVDAGKSTLLGVLTHGELDNGRGLARQKLFRHKHEMESGRTSSIGNDILGFDSRGKVVNQPDPHGGHLDWVKICQEASKVITFIDLAGHEKYLKTTIFGMTGHAPDFTMLMVGANAGVVGMTKEHLGLALALNVPVFVVVTKVDMCPPNVLANTLKLLQRVLKSPGCRKIPVLVSSEDDVVLAATNFATERLCPIFQVSNVTGHNLDLLKSFMNLLHPRTVNYDNEPAEFQIDDHYSVPGVGTVVSGLTMKGVIRLNDILCLGPDSTGKFVNVAIKSIHRKRMPVKEVRSGQTASFALKKIKRSDIRKGMVMVSPALHPQAYWEFEGEILVLHHPTTISPRYQAMVHCGSVRQTACILSMSRDYLRTGDKAKVYFRFMKTPEYFRAGQKMVFREGRTKAIGTITKVIPGQPPAIPSKGKKMIRQYNDAIRHTTDQENEPVPAADGDDGRREKRTKSHYKYERKHRPFFANANSSNGATSSTSSTVTSAGRQTERKDSK